MLYPMEPSLHWRVVHWLNRHKNKIGLLAIGHTAKRVEEYLFDWLLYGIVVLWSINTWGSFWGSIVAFFIMAPTSALFCWIYILFYDWAKKDWFGFEALKELRETETQGVFGRIFRRVVRFGDIPAFILLSIYSDPFMVAVYFRKKGHEHRGLTRRDWKIFWASVVVSNAYWTLRWTVIFEVVRVLWNTAIQPFLLSAGFM